MRNLDALKRATPTTKWGKDWVQKIQAEGPVECSEAQDALDIMHETDNLQQADWDIVIYHAIQAGCAYEDVAEDVYDERVCYNEDNGWLRQNFEHYTTADHACALLAKPATWQHPSWDALATALFFKSQEAEHGTEFCTDLLIPRIQAGNFNWKPYIELILEHWYHDFLVYLVDVTEIIDAPEFWSWIAPYQDSAQLHSSFLKNKNTQKHPKWPQIFERLMDNPQLKVDSDFPKLMKLYEQLHNSKPY